MGTVLREKKVWSPSATQQYTATTTGLTNTSATWSVDNVAGGNSSVGTIGTTGLYTAPSAIGLHTITAASAAVPSDAVSGRVTVVNIAKSTVLTYHNDDARDGAYPEEVTLTPSISANGNNNGVVWDIGNSTYVGNNPVASGLPVSHVYDATNVAHELYNSAQAGTRDQAGLL